MNFDPSDDNLVTGKMWYGSNLIPRLSARDIKLVPGRKPGNEAIPFVPAALKLTAVDSYCQRVRQRAYRRRYCSMCMRGAFDSRLCHEGLSNCFLAMT